MSSIAIRGARSYDFQPVGNQLVQFTIECPSYDIADVPERASIRCSLNLPDFHLSIYGSCDNNEQAIDEVKARLVGDLKAKAIAVASELMVFGKESQ